MPARLIEHLVQRGVLTPDRGEQALRQLAISGGSIDTAVLELGGIAEPVMLQALGDVSGLPPVNLADFEPNQDVALIVPPKICDRLGVVPLSSDGTTLHVAC